MSTNEPNEQEIAENRRGCSKGCVIAAAVPLVLVIIFLCIIFYEPHYTHFGRHRTREMEETFGFSVTDGIRLEEYRYVSGWLCEDEEILTVSGIGDYRAFIAENVSGELVRRHENGIEYDCKTNAQSKSHYNADVIKYEYNIAENEDKFCAVYVQFDMQEDGTYKAVFNKYY